MSFVETMTRFGTDITPSSFPDDDGAADSEVLAALHIHAASQSALTEAGVITSLRGTRLLVPIVAHADSVDETRAEKDSHIAAVTFESRDGRVGLPAFTSLDSLREWNPEARPLPQFAENVAQSCIDQGFDALLIDMASSHRCALTKPALIRLLSRATRG